MMPADPLQQEQPLDLREAAKFVLANWVQELNALFGPVLAGASEEVVLCILPDRLELHHVFEGADEVIGTSAWSAGAQRAGIAELNSLLERAGSSRSMTVRLPSDAVLRPHVKLPKAGRTALRGALRYEVDRLSPIASSRLYYDYSFANEEDGAVDVELRIVRKELLDEVVAALHAIGISVSEIRFEGDGRAADWRAFPVDRSALLGRLATRFRRLALVGLSCLLLLAVIAGAYFREAAMFSAATEASTQAGIQAARVEKLQHTIEQTTSAMAFAAQQKRSPLLVEVLAELTRILPDGTWVTQLTFDGKSVRVAGASASASDLIGLIDRSRQFHNAKFEAPLIHDQAANTDRFDLSFQLRGR